MALDNPIVILEKDVRLFIVAQVNCLLETCDAIWSNQNTINIMKFKYVYEN